MNGTKNKSFFIICINCLMLFASGNFISAQTSIVKGKVSDYLNAPIPYVNVFLKTTDTDRVVSFTTTTEFGMYELRHNVKGDFLLNFSSIAYQTSAIPITIDEDSIYIQDVKLQDENFTLDEVIINSEKAITVKEDTIIYRASAFKKGNEDNVEDLLKNIPGINVEGDGTIKVGNKQIEKLLIEGDDLFGKGYKMLSKNLDASTISKVEVYDKYSENRLLKGVENSDKVAINLRLNDTSSKILGVLKPGYGLATENRYDSKANFILLSKKSKHYLFTDFNNVGFDSTSDLSLFDATQDLTDISTPSNFPRATGFIKTFQRPRDLEKERSNFNNSEMVSLTDIFTLSEKVKIKTNILLNWDEKDFFNENRSEYVLTDSINFLQKDTNALNGDQLLGSGDITLNYDIAANKIFEYKGNFSNTNLDINTDLSFNEIPSKEILLEDALSSTHSVIFTNKLQKDAVLQLHGDFAYSETPQLYTTNQFVFDELFESDGNSTIKQTSEHKVAFFKLKGSYLKKLKNKNLLKISAVTEYTGNRLNSNFSLTNGDNNSEELLRYFKNDIKYSILNNALTASYNHKFGALGINGTLEVLQNTNYLENETTELQDNGLFINPLLGFDLAINKNNKLNTSVGLKSKSPTLRNVSKGYILTDFNTFTKGFSSNVEQLQSFTVFGNYRLGTILSPFFSNTSVYYEKNLEYYTNDTEFTPQYILSEQYRAEGRSLLSLRSDSNIFVGFIDTNLKVKGGYMNQRYQNRVNGNTRDVSINSLNYGLELRSAFSGDINFHLGTNFTDTRVEIDEGSRNINNQSFLDVVYAPTEKLNVSFNTETYTFNVTENDKTYYFADLKTTYQAIKNKLTLTVEGKNLFNVKEYTTFAISDVGNSRASYRLLPRFLLLKARIKL